MVENTAFLGDLILRLPDIIHDILKRKKDWTLLAQWGVGFCEMANIYEEHDTRLLDLVCHSRVSISIPLESTLSWSSE